MVKFSHMANLLKFIEAEIKVGDLIRVHFGEGGEDEALVEATGGSGGLSESG